MTLNRLSILIDNELGEVPLDAVKQHSTLLLLQIFPQRVSFFAVNIDFFEQIELDFVIASEALNFFSVSRLLVIELVAWKSEYAKTWEEKRSSYKRKFVIQDLKKTGNKILKAQTSKSAVN